MRRRGFAPSPSDLAAAAAWLLEGPGEMGLSQEVEAENPSFLIASSVTLEVTSSIQPSFPALQAVPQSALSTENAHALLGVWDTPESSPL